MRQNLVECRFDLELRLVRYCEKSAGEASTRSLRIASSLMSSYELHPCEPWEYKSIGILSELPKTDVKTLKD